MNDADIKALCAAHNIDTHTTTADDGHSLLTLTETGWRTPTQPRIRRRRHRSRRERRRLTMHRGRRRVVLRTLSQLADHLPAVLATSDRRSERVGVRAAVQHLHPLHIRRVFQQVNEVIAEIQRAHQ
ncbi:hypothetical protein [Streptomyces sp. NPDC086519]|uniref:hypothetical protein n=1 Tax=Streptomyces sp. NPDC086519 TaxID=3154863 RepID=UPI0034406B3F